MKRLFLLPFLVFLNLAFGQEAYTLGAESTLTIDGTSTIHDWTVTANKMTGTLTATEGTPKEISFEVNVADIQSERGATMDKKMHDALKKEEHPKVSFALKEVKGASTLVGTLTIAGIEKEVEIDTELTVEDAVRIKGEKKITLQDFSMKPPTAMFGQIVVGDEVMVKFDLLFKGS